MSPEYLIVAKSVKVPASRRQGCRCSNLPKNLGNEEDGIFTLFPKGKNFWKKDEMAEPTYDDVLKASLNSKLLLYRQLISSFMIKFLCNVEVNRRTGIGRPTCPGPGNRRVKTRTGLNGWPLLQSGGRRSARMLYRRSGVTAA